MSEHKFGSGKQLLGAVNDPETVAHADTKPIYTPSKNANTSSFLEDEDSGMRARTERLDSHKAVYNESTGEIFTVVTDEYQVMNPPTFIDPLVTELEDRNRGVNGTIYMSDSGGRGYVEMLLDDTGIWPEDREGRSEPVRTGLTVRWSHDGGVSVRASAFAQDGSCKNTMRQVSDSIYVKHAGDMERVDFREEWAETLDSLGAFSESLEAVIQSAFDYEIIDLGETDWESDWLEVMDGHGGLEELGVPAYLEDHDRDGIYAMYDLLGFPKYLALEATDRLLWRMRHSGHTAVTGWDAYSAATYALTHEARFDQHGDSADEYHRKASDILLNPQAVMQQADEQARIRAEPAEEQETLLLEEDEGDAMREYSERERELREALQ